MKQLNTHFDPIGHRPITGKIVYSDHLENYIHVPPDDGKPTNFKWHFQRGLLKPRMSGLELCEFVLKHMSAILGQGLLKAHPRIEVEFKTIFLVLVTSPKRVIDRLLPWIRVEYHEQEDDIIYLNMFEKRPQQTGPLHFDLGA